MSDNINLRILAVRSRGKIRHHVALNRQGFPIASTPMATAPNAAAPTARANKLAADMALDCSLTSRDIGHLNETTVICVAVRR
jgi:hypothetical protein